MLKNNYLVVYRDSKTQKIELHTYIKRSMYESEAQLREAIENFNSKGNRTAVLIELVDGDVVAYLAEKLQSASRLDKDSVASAIDDVESALDSLRMLLADAEANESQKAVN